MEVRQLTNNVKREYMNVHHCELEFDLSRPEYLTIVNFSQFTVTTQNDVGLIHFLTQKILLLADAILKP